MKDYSKLLASLPPDQRLALLDLIKNQGKKDEKARFNLENILFSKQLEVFNNSNAKNVIVCSRRSGKSYFVASLLLHTAMVIPEDSLFYIGLTKAAARRVIWGILTKMIRDYSLDCKVNDHLLTITFPNYTTISVEGAKDASTIERLRGVKSSLAVVDEAQGIPVGLGVTLVQDVVIPFLSDNAGKLFLTGTPDALCQSVLYKAWKGEEKGWKGFKPFHWNVTDNEKFPRFLNGVSTPEGYLQEVMEATGYTIDSPTFQREYLGLFVKDEGSLVYNFDYKRDVCEDLPNGEWYYILSGDTGFKDSDAIIVVAFNYSSPTAYVVDEFTKDGLGVDEFITLYMEFYEKYNPISSVIDYGGGGLKVIESINQRYHINTKACKKWTPKAIGAAVVSAEFQGRRLKVLTKCESLISQLESITWVTKTNRDGVIQRVIPDGSQVRDAHGTVVSDDCADALLYAMNEVRNYLSIEEPILSEEESLRRMLDGHKKSILERAKKAEEERQKQRTFY